MRPPTPRPPRTSCSCAALHPPGRGWALHVPAARLARPPEGRPGHPRGDRRHRRSGDALPGSDTGGAMGGFRPDQPADPLQAPGLGRHFVLPMSHEETMTFHARELKSYKQLPQLWYHFSTKERDEPRARRPPPSPRVHHERLVLVRLDAAGLTRASSGTPRRTRASSSAAASRRTSSRRSPGSWAARSHPAFSRPTGSGENELMRCENGDYFADIEAARGAPCARVPGAA